VWKSLVTYDYKNTTYQRNDNYETYKLAYGFNIILKLLKCPVRDLCSREMVNLSLMSLVKITPVIGEFVNLKYLYLDNNYLKSIPTEIGKLRKLQTLVLDNNELKIIPAEICNIASLRVICARHNKLNSIPTELGKLHNLEILNLVYNNLSKIPSELGLIQNLRTLEVDKYVRIPDELDKFSGWTTVNKK
jgi:Leucine-rich repeat (LRR) protein